MRGTRAKAIRRALVQAIREASGGRADLPSANQYRQAKRAWKARPR